MTLDLSNPRVVRALLAQAGLRPRRRMGQNFLVDRHVLELTVRTLAPAPEDLVLEIGPGLGVLTRAVAACAAHVLTIEVDPGMLRLLRHTLAGVDNVDMIEGDALKIDLAALLSERLPPGRKALVAANLPYYITSPLLFRLLEEGLPLARLVVMVQREVAERMTAPPGGKDYGALSVMVQNYTEPRLVTRVPARAFWPPPKVDSALVLLNVREVPVVHQQPATFRAVVRAAFGQRRKTLLNSLAAGLALDKPVVDRALRRVGIDPQRRGETLSLAEFGSVTLSLAPIGSDTEALQE